MEAGPPPRTHPRGSTTASSEESTGDGHESLRLPLANQSSAPTSTSASIPGSYRCRLCSRAYERADHLNRHMKSHENARPHKCSQCPKRFNRADLLNRHEASHTGQLTRRGDGNERVSTACTACVQSKCKCQDQKPCARCLRKNILCEVTGSNAPRANVLQEIDVQLSHVEHNSNQTLDSRNQRSELANLRNTSDEVNSSKNAAAGNEFLSNRVMNPAGSQDVPDNSYANEASMSMNNDLSVLNDSYSQYPQTSTNFQFNQSLGFYPRDLYFGQDLDVAMWDVDLTSFEISQTNIDSDPPITQDESLSIGAVDKTHVWRRHAAFKRSPWIWDPTPEDHSLNDQTNLNVDEDSVSLALTPHTPVATLDQFSHCCIDSNMRDQLLHLLFAIPVNNAPIKFFPPLKLVNLIIGVYFVHSRTTVDNIIHAATFDPYTALPQLLISIISAGASSVSAPAIWKMGLALQEFIRHTVSNLWERNNLQTRNIQAIQAWMIGLDVGLWSGIKRKMEIAESSCQPIIMMLRRIGIFSARNGSPVGIPTLEDSEKVLCEKWTNFAERESFKRLALHLFIHDAQSSISFYKPPQISFTELQVDLPVSRDLWLADSASQWRSNYLGKQAMAVPSLMDVLRNPEILSKVSSQVDIKLCSTVTLLGYWGQLWRLMEAQKFYPSSRSAYRLSLMTEHDELYRDLLVTATKTSQLCRNDASINILGNLLMLFLHVTPEDLQRFAGKYGVDESRKVSELFETWCLTVAGRNAIWHAGQVLGAAKNMMATQLRDFHAIAVYYAALTLWVYGTMTRSRGEAGMDNFPPNTPVSNVSSRDRTNIFLNCEALDTTAKFRETGEGVPGMALLDGDQLLEFAPLTSTDRILYIARCLYRTNFPVYDQPLPPLLENLSNLMRDLSSSPGSRASRAGSEEA